MSDLVKALRSEGNLRVAEKEMIFGDWKTRDARIADDLCHKAADEIERLQRELSEARRQAFIEAATLIDEGFDRGIKRKQDTCAHGKFQWEDCEQCASKALRDKSEETRI